ncbi:hypothetical protein ABT160_30105 [Streptomyces sp. NPDC001941]|uniref:hypothetical protein n=1 Tax=Streptomyces sp. NPDC001941 TaxID=3154659 RepID=UPI0033224AB3
MVLPGRQGSGEALDQAAAQLVLTPKAPAALRRILRAYQHAHRRVLYLATEPVLRQLHGRPGPGGHWTDGLGQDLGLLPPGPPDDTLIGLLAIRPYIPNEPAVARRITQQAARHR